MAAHESAGVFVDTDAGYTADISFDFVRLCDIDGETVRLSPKTWADLRDRVIEAQRAAYVSGFFHGWERLDYGRACLDWLDSPESTEQKD